MLLRSWHYASSFILRLHFFLRFLFFFAFSLFCVLMKMDAEAGELHVHTYLLRLDYWSSKIKLICCILILKGSLSILYILILKGSLSMFLYINQRFLLFSLLCWVCIFLRFRFFFFASSFLCVFVLWNMRLRSQEYGSSFSGLCFFVLQQKRKLCQLSSGEYCT